MLAGRGPDLLPGRRVRIELRLQPRNRRIGDVEGLKITGEACSRRTIPDALDARSGLRTARPIVRPDTRSHRRRRGDGEQPTPGPNRPRPSAGQPGLERVHRGPALRGIEGHATREDRTQPAGARLEVLAGRTGCRALAGQGPCQRFVQAHAQRVLIAARGRDLPQPLLGRHVRERPHHRAALGQRRALLGIVAAIARLGVGDGVLAGQPEVDDPHAALTIDHRVAGLDVPVHEARVVDRLQTPRVLTVRIDDPLGRGLLIVHPPPQRLPRDQLHRDEHLRTVAADLENLHHVRMRDPSQRSRLAYHPGLDTRVRVTAARREELDGDRTLERLVEGLEHHAHSPRADLLAKRVPADARRRGRFVEQAGRDRSPHQLGVGAVLLDQLRGQQSGDVL